MVRNLKLTHNRQIKDFINHDYTKSNIYLFMRENSHLKYSYLGNLAYVSHNINKNSPITFKWQIIDWNSELGKISLNKNIKDKDVINKIDEEDKNSLEKIDSKEFTVNLINSKVDLAKIEEKKKEITEYNNINKNFENDSKENTRLGNKGEDVVESFEKKHLYSIGRDDLAEKVIAVRKIAGNEEKFDVLSFEDDGTKKYIEVKTTTGPINNAFYISEKEVQFSESKFKNHYYLYRLFNFNKKTKSTNLAIIKGPINRSKLNSIKYSCYIDSSKTFKNTEIHF